MSIFTDSYGHMREGWSPVIVFSIAAVVIYLLMFVAQRMKLPGELADIDAVRAEIGQCIEAEDMRGMMVETNQYILGKQRYNHVWWSALAIPNKWDEIELIDVPECER